MVALVFTCSVYCGLLLYLVGLSDIGYLRLMLLFVVGMFYSVYDVCLWVTVFYLWTCFVVDIFVYEIAGLLFLSWLVYDVLLDPTGAVFVDCYDTCGFGSC